jgi:hypothetical protein
MKLIYLLLAVTICSFTACAQQTKTNQKVKEQNSVTNKIDSKMDLSKLTNEQVKKAVEAQLNNDKTAWFALFTEKVKFTDDGNNLEFKSFFENAFKHNERFLSIERVENHGKDLYGHFDAGQWGVFNVYFKFHQNAEGKFDRLDIGADK